MVIEILNGGEILLNCKFKLNKNLNLNLHRKILRNSNPTKIPIRLCTVRAGSCNSSVQMCTPVNATDVTAKAIFERLYLVPGRRTFALSINCLCAFTSPTAHSVLTLWLILKFSAFLTLVAPHFFSSTIRQVIWTSPGTLIALLP